MNNVIEANGYQWGWHNITVMIGNKPITGIKPVLFVSSKENIRLSKKTKPKTQQNTKKSVVRRNGKVR